MQSPAKPALTKASLFMKAVTYILSKHGRVFWGDRLMTLDKNTGFFEDPVFMQAYREIRGSHIYDAYDSPHTIAWRLHTLVWAAKQGLSLPGDFVECGVFKGDMASVVARCTDFAHVDKRYFLYDSFSGLSEKYSSPADFPDAPEFFDVAQKAYGQQGLYEAVCKRFAVYPNVQVVRGLVPDVFAEKVPEKIAFLHVDLNSAQAEIGALEVLFDRVVPGGVIVFDDYGWYLYRKQKQAEDRFMSARGYAILELPTGQGMVVKKA